MKTFYIYKNIFQMNLEKFHVEFLLERIFSSEVLQKKIEKA
jgi:hypothetical protein